MPYTFRGENGILRAVDIHSKTQMGRIFRGIRSVDVAFIFGSEARGESKGSSDVDIALLITNCHFSQDRLDLKLKVSNRLSKLTNKDIDIVFLNNAGSILKYQIARDGDILFERKQGLAKKFRLNAIKEYFDYVPIFNFHYDRLKAAGRTNGKRGTN